MSERFVISVVAWGKPYLDLFLNVGLPTVLAPGNIPALTEEAEVSLCLITDVPGLRYLAKRPDFIRLTGLIKVQIIARSLDQGDPFDLLQDAHNLTIRRANRDGATIIFLGPDFVMADGTLRRLLELRRMGYRAVHVLTPRLTAQSATAALIAHKGNRSQGAIQLSPRELVRLGLEHIHPIEKAYFWTAGTTSFPIHVYREVGAKGFLANCFYLHPIMVRPRIRGVLPMGTIDADFTDRCCPRLTDSYVVTDTDEIACFELTRHEVEDTNSKERPPFARNVWNLGRWASVNANPCFDSHLHHWMVQQLIYVHAEDLDQNWQESARLATRFARRLRWCTLVHYGLRSAMRARRFIPDTRLFDPPNSTRVKEPDRQSWRRSLWHWLRWRWLGLLTKDIADCHLNEGWGPPLLSPSGLSFGRWLGNDGRGRLMLPFPRSSTITLFTTIEASRTSRLALLSVKVNGRMAHDQTVSRRSGRYIHSCTARIGHDFSGRQLQVDYLVKQRNPGAAFALGEVRLYCGIMQNAIRVRRNISLALRLRGFHPVSRKHQAVVSHLRVNGELEASFNLPWGNTNQGRFLLIRLYDQSMDPERPPVLTVNGQQALDQRILLYRDSFYLTAFCPLSLLQRRDGPVTMKLRGPLQQSPPRWMLLTGVLTRRETRGMRSWLTELLSRRVPSFWGTSCLNHPSNESMQDQELVCQDRAGEERFTVELKMNDSIDYWVKLFYQGDDASGLSVAINDQTLSPVDTRFIAGRWVSVWSVSRRLVKPMNMQRITIRVPKGMGQDLKLERLVYRPKLTSDLAHHLWKEYKKGPM